MLFGSYCVVASATCIPKLIGKHEFFPVYLGNIHKSGNTARSVAVHASKFGGRSFGHGYESRVPFRCTERVAMYAARRICSFNSSSGLLTKKYANAPQKLSPAPCKKAFQWFSVGLLVK